MAAPWHWGLRLPQGPSASMGPEDKFIVLLHCLFGAATAGNAKHNVTRQSHQGQTRACAVGMAIAGLRRTSKSVAMFDLLHISLHLPTPIPQDLVYRNAWSSLKMIARAFLNYTLNNLTSRRLREGVDCQATTHNFEPRQDAEPRRRVTASAVALGAMRVYLAS